MKSDPRVDRILTWRTTGSGKKQTMRQAKTGKRKMGKGSLSYEGEPRGEFTPQNGLDHNMRYFLRGVYIPYKSKKTGTGIVILDTKHDDIYFHNWKLSEFAKHKGDPTWA